MNMRKRFWIAALTAVGVIIGVLCYDKSPKYDGTPFVVGSGEYVGYTAVEANGFTKPADCISDPETKNDAQYVTGCQRYFSGK
ncbi:MAG: hypothetical protein H7Z73_08155 [Candidatus Saccharibacteria bacterium]|nr:hypothetical protein [Moraxellaceae bacterium]